MTHRVEGCASPTNLDQGGSNAECALRSRKIAARRVLESGQLSVCRPDLSLRQPLAQAITDQGAYQAAPARPLGNNARPELHLCSFESNYKEERPGHDLHYWPRPRWAGAGRQRLSRG